ERSAPTLAPYAGMTQTGSMGLISAAQRAAPQAVIATLSVFAGANKMPRRPRPGARLYRFRLHQQLRADRADQHHGDARDRQRQRRAQLFEPDAVEDRADAAADKERE